MTIPTRRDDRLNARASRIAGALFAAFLALLLAPTVTAARNDEAPAPRRSPREQVVQQPLVIEKKTTLPPARSLSGTAAILDTEKLRLNEVDLRLFGVVAPQLSAPFGPQTRAVLDSLATEGPAQCAVRDRDREGRLLATCRSANGTDFALELLKRGLAVTARGSLRTSDLGASYVAAEQAAQAQRSGLWSVAPPAAASDAAIREAAAREAKEKAEDAQRAQDRAREEERRKEAEKTAAPAAAPAPATTAASAAPAPSTDSAATPSSRPVVASLAGGTAIAETIAASPPPRTAPSVAGAPISITPMPPSLGAGAPVAAVATASAATEAPAGGFFARYQLLLTGILMVFSSFAIFFGLGLQKWMDRRESLRALAAALRGELMAARALCLSRLRALAHDAEDRHIAWPRVRVLVFQAHVGRLGELGADLARQIASIYGQASDYAAYYAASGDPSAAPVSKRQALLTLAQHIEEVLPRLVWIEQRGRRAPSAAPAPTGAALPLPTSPGGPGTSLPAPDPASAAEPSAPEEVKAPPHPAESPARPEAPRAMREQKEEKLADAPFVEEKPKRAKSRATREETRPPKGEAPPAVPVPPTATPENPVPAFPSAAAAATGAASLKAEPREKPTATTTSPLLPVEPADADDSAPPLWSALRRMASKPFEKTRHDREDPDAPPDYTALSDEEIEALAYSTALLEEEDAFPATKVRRAR